MSAAAAGRGRPLHLHAEGPRGTGKTSVLRAARAALAPIVRVRGCPYNCDPEAPHCPVHRDWSRGALAEGGAERVPAPFLELSASAKLATAVGAIDLARLLDRSRPEAALLPGTLARSHRGVVFVDEINRLADVAPELTDALLDVMGTKPGRLQIEEAGLPPVELTVDVTVWAASNPDEEPGPLEQTRLQLADRFDLRVAVEPPRDAAVVFALLQQGLGAAAPAPDPGAAPGWPQDAGSGPEAAWPAHLLRFLADFYVRSGLDSLRALAAWREAAGILAAREGRRRVEAGDVRRAARWTLRGRLDPEAAERGLRALDAAGNHSAGPDPSGAPAGGTEGSGAAEDAAGGDGAGTAGAAPPARAAPRRIAAVRPVVLPEWTGAAADAEGGREA